MLTNVIKVFKPPYKIHDLPAVLGVVLLLLIIPVISLNLGKINTKNPHAATLPCPNFGNYGDVNRDGLVSLADAQLTASNLYNTAFWTPDILKRGDVDGNGKIEYMDVVSIRRYAEASPQQITFKVCAENDGDGFPNLVEDYLGTAKYYPCGVNNWPPDFNNDQKVTLQDVLQYSGKIGLKADTTALKRLDLDADGYITQAGDIGGSGYPNGIFIKYYGKSCQILQYPAVIYPATLTANPNPVITGDNVTLSWDIQGQVTRPCFQTAGAGFNGVVDVRGSYAAPVYNTGNSTYTIECGGYNGGVIRSTTVSAISPCPSYIKTGQLYTYTPDGRVFIINASCQKQWVNSPDAMAWCHYDWSKIQSGTSVDKYLPYVVEGGAIGVGSSCPSGSTGVQAFCSGDPWLDNISPNPPTAGQLVTFHASQLKGGCNKYDTVKFYIQNSPLNANPPRCTLENVTWCAVTFTAPAAGSYPIRACRDNNNNGTDDQCSIDGNGNPEFVWMTVISGIDPPYIKPIDCSLIVTNGFYSSHRALDLQCSGGYNATIGQPVRSVSSGTVIYKGDLDGGFSCGIEVKVKTVASDGRKFVFRYCHLSGTPIGIDTGVTVSQGQTLGWVGNTGSTSGGLLHLCTELNGPETCYSASGSGQIDPRTIINF